MARTIVVEDWNVEDCRARAARALGVSADRLSLRVLRKAKRGFFTSRPFKVSASVADEQPTRKAGGYLSKLDLQMQMALNEMERFESLREANEGRVFNEILASYEEMSEERQKEVTQLSEMLSGTAARKIQQAVAKNGRCAVTVSEDGMKACLSVWPAEGIGRPVSMRNILDRLREARVSYGIDHVQMRRVLAEVGELNHPVEGVVVATGQPAEPGVDGRIELLVARPGKVETSAEDGRVDHRGKAVIPMVKSGQVLARLVPPEVGKAGMTVLGAEIEPRVGKEAELKAGENVTFDPDSGEYRADIDGVFEMSEGAISVLRNCVIPGDVDMTTGNIEFDGAVKIMGTVRDGFTVKARDNIDIMGGVEGAQVISEEGSICVHQGVAGRDRCFLSAAKDLSAKYIENARAYARNDIKVQVAVMHSEVVAGNAVTATGGGRGAIIGGTTQAGMLIQALTLGAPSEPVTTLVVGIGLEDQERIRELDQHLTELRSAAATLEEAIAGVERATKNIDGLPRDRRERYLALKKKLIILHHETDSFQEKRSKLMSEVSAEAKGEVKAHREVYAKVIVRIGQFVEHVTSRLASTTFQADPEKGRVVRS